MTECNHRLAACLAPAHGTTGSLGQHSEQDFFGVGVDLGAESTADIGGDDAHDVWFDAERCGDAGLGALSMLRGDPLDESTLAPHGRTATNFERTRGDSLIVDTCTHHDVAAIECVVSDAGHAEHGGVDDDVAPDRVIQRDRTRCHC